MRMSALSQTPLTCFSHLRVLYLVSFTYPLESKRNPKSEFLDAIKKEWNTIQSKLDMHGSENS